MNSLEEEVSWKLGASPTVLLSAETGVAEVLVTAEAAWHERLWQIQRLLMF